MTETEKERDQIIGNLLDRWEMTPNDIKEEMREHGCGKQLDTLSAYIDRNDGRNPARSAVTGFDRIVAARKAHVDAVSAYNARHALAQSERARGNWSIKLDAEYRTMSDTQSEFIRTAQEVADAALNAKGQADE